MITLFLVLKGYFLPIPQLWLPDTHRRPFPTSPGGVDALLLSLAQVTVAPPLPVPPRSPTSPPGGPVEPCPARCANPGRRAWITNFYLCLFYFEWGLATLMDSFHVSAHFSLRLLFFFLLISLYNLKWPFVKWIANIFMLYCLSFYFVLPPYIYFFIFMRLNTFIFHFMDSRFCIILRMIQHYGFVYSMLSSSKFHFLLLKSLVYMEYIQGVRQKFKSFP